MRRALLGILAAAAAGAARGQESGDRSAEQLTALLKQTRISVSLKEASLRDLVEVVRAQLNRNLIISPKVWEERPEDQLKINVALKDVSVQTLLRVTLKPNGLTLAVREGIMMVVPQSAVQERILTKVYDLRDLTTAVKHFPSTEVPWGIPSPGGSGNLTQGATYSSIFGGIDRSDAPEVGGTTADSLQQLIQAHTGGKSWAENTKTQLKFVAGTGVMVVSQSRAVHEEIEAFLDALRRMR
jgi:hypothetical protein